MVSEPPFFYFEDKKTGFQQVSGHQDAKPSFNLGAARREVPNKLDGRRSLQRNQTWHYWCIMTVPKPEKAMEKRNNHPPCLYMVWLFNIQVYREIPFDDPSGAFQLFSIEIQYQRSSMWLYIIRSSNNSKQCFCWLHGKLFTAQCMPEIQSFEECSYRKVDIQIISNLIWSVDDTVDGGNPAPVDR